jgi:hypothetical protein
MRKVAATAAARTRGTARLVRDRRVRAPVARQRHCAGLRGHRRQVAGAGRRDVRHGLPEVARRPGAVRQRLRRRGARPLGRARQNLAGGRHADRRPRAAARKHSCASARCSFTSTNDVKVAPRATRLRSRTGLASGIWRRRDRRTCDQARQKSRRAPCTNHPHDAGPPRRLRCSRVHQGVPAPAGSGVRMQHDPSESEHLDVGGAATEGDPITDPTNGAEHQPGCVGLLPVPNLPRAAGS